MKEEQSREGQARMEEEYERRRKGRSFPNPANWGKERQKGGSPTST